MCRPAEEIFCRGELSQGTLVAWQAVLLQAPVRQREAALPRGAPLVLLEAFRRTGVAAARTL